MKIYGEHDYYDCALAYGQDPLCVWNRAFEEHKYRNYEIEDLIDNVFDNDLIYRTWIDAFENIVLDRGCVLFCGKAFHFISTRKHDETNFHYFYNYESLIKYFESIHTHKKVQAFLQDKHRVYRRKTKKTHEEILKNYFKRDAFKDKQEILHRFNNIPIYIIHKGTVYVGGSLDKFEFQKNMDPFTCLQELNMYISGVLGGQSPKMIEINDIDKIEGKGFDKVTSFRNMKRD